MYILNGEWCGFWVDISKAAKKKGCREERRKTQHAAEGVVVLESRSGLSCAPTSRAYAEGTGDRPSQMPETAGVSSQTWSGIRLPPGLCLGVVGPRDTVSLPVQAWDPCGCRWDPRHVCSRAGELSGEAGSPGPLGASSGHRGSAGVPGSLF